MNAAGVTEKGFQPMILFLVQQTVHQFDKLSGESIVFRPDSKQLVNNQRKETNREQNECTHKTTAEFSCVEMVCRSKF